MWRKNDVITIPTREHVEDKYCVFKCKETGRRYIATDYEMEHECIGCGKNHKLNPERYDTVTYYELYEAMNNTLSLYMMSDSNRYIIYRACLVIDSYSKSRKRDKKFMLLEMYDSLFYDRYIETEEKKTREKKNV